MLRDPGVAEWAWKALESDTGGNLHPVRGDLEPVPQPKLRHNLPG